MVSVVCNIKQFIIITALAYICILINVKYIVYTPELLSNYINLKFCFIYVYIGIYIYTETDNDDDNRSIWSDPGVELSTLPSPGSSVASEIDSEAETVSTDILLQSFYKMGMNNLEKGKVHINDIILYHGSNLKMYKLHIVLVKIRKTARQFLM